MKTKILTLLLILAIAACEKESTQKLIQEDPLSEASFRKAPKIKVCHYDAYSDTYEIINISSNAWKVHEKHGDVQLVDADGDGYIVENPCGYTGDKEAMDCDDNNFCINPAASEICNNNIDDDCDGEIDENGCSKIFAIAYTNTNGQAGFQGGEDVLIAKLIDGNNDGTLNIGDKIITHQYPTNFEGTDFGVFTIKEHEFSNIAGMGSTQINVTSPEGSFNWISSADREQYREIKNPFRDTNIFDNLSSSFFDQIVVDKLSPSNPQTAVPTTVQNLRGDDSFIDVDIFLN